MSLFWPPCILHARHGCIKHFRAFIFIISISIYVQSFSLIYQRFFIFSKPLTVGVEVVVI